MATKETISFRDTVPTLERERRPVVSGFSTSDGLLPPLDQNGFLPAGIHDSRLDIISARFAHSPIRRELWYKGVTFLSFAAATGKFNCAYLAGGFITGHLVPFDLDLILETEAPYGPEAFKAMEPFFVQGLDRILNQYSVHLHFYFANSSQNLKDFRELFQYFGPHEAYSFGLPPGSRKGIVRIKL